MILRQTRFAKGFVILLSIVLLSNIMLYQPAFQRALSFELEQGVVIGSMLDLVLIAPILAYAAFKISKKQTIGLMVLGLVAARFLVPEEFFAPFTVMLYAGIVFEGLFVLAELGLVVYVIRKIPLIKAEMKQMNAGSIFTLLPAVENKASANVLIRILISEALLIYYALFTWKKKASDHNGVVTMHKKTSSIAIHIMVIHAIIIETIGIHWWLHSKMPILSFVLLVLNLYSILLFLAEIQITRLHPLEVKDGRIYVTKGLMQRVVVKVENITAMEWGRIQSKHHNAMSFVLKDFEEVEPQVVLILKEPVQATLFMGREKWVDKLALRVDDPEKLKRILLDTGGIEDHS